MKNIKKIITITFLIGFVLLNIITYNQAYNFTHFAKADAMRTQKPENLSLLQKIGLLFTGVTLPKPSHTAQPNQPYETVLLQSHEQIEAWLIPNTTQKGIVIMGHGYSSNKSALIGYSNEFQGFGYTTFLIDFMGSGGSGGYETTIGYKEAEDIKAAFEYIQKRFPEEQIYLFGPSMAAASIMRAMAIYDLPVAGVLVECPFGTMRQTTVKRFQAMNIPSFPFADMLLLYGGLQVGFNAYRHRPAEYAKLIIVPSLLLYGEKDARVTMEETQTIFQNLKGEKQLVTFPKSGHENYLKQHRKEWKAAVAAFLDKNDKTVF